MLCCDVRLSDDANHQMAMASKRKPVDRKQPEKAARKAARKMAKRQRKEEAIKEWHRRRRLAKLREFVVGTTGDTLPAHLASLERLLSQHSKGS